MACLPYPAFRTVPPAPPAAVSGDGSGGGGGESSSSSTLPGAIALSAAGRARVYPLDCFGEAGGDSSSAADEFRAIVSKCADHSRVVEGDEGKKRKKRLMKESVAMARVFVYETCGIDASVVDAEIVLRAEDVLASDGALASFFLDAGCARIVVEIPPRGGEGEASSWEALEMTRLPTDRLVAHFATLEGAWAALGEEGGANVSRLVGTLSVGGLTRGEEAEEAREMLMAIGKCSGGGMKLVVNLSACVDDNGGGGGIERLAETVQSVSKAMGENKGAVALEDPTVEALGMSYAACLRTDRDDGLYTTVVCSRGGVALGLVYSSKESIVAALRCGRGVYFSRSRGGLWRKGDTSGHYQTLHRLDADCDGDALRFTVTQKGEGGGAFCHLNTLTCWGAPRGLSHLERTLGQRLVDAPPGSYTKRLFDDEQLLRDKLVEEAQELSEAEGARHVTEELADLLYFALARAAKAGVTVDDVQSVLDERARKVTRRKGDSKAFRIEAGEAILKNKQGDEGKKE